ncbi:hypothetical protein HELRODRAFT_189247 [Helobdella robusta]|uniref:HMG box domain-containing protein n=1 Tax=Helobdella robusta TaxID=6412 RepID=T1FQV2_HELRO|nr:hypothetical protein HELRODRAFT_189247 [Helobdella robusta]ESN96454.1 hypothetical protein HELRODRAFT_189247 [Helobdella robusta]
MEIGSSDATKSGRIRKKTSKFLEMEEMEIFEKFVVESKKRKSKGSLEGPSSKSVTSSLSSPSLVLKLPKPTSEMHSNESSDDKKFISMSMLLPDNFYTEDYSNDNNIFTQDHIDDNEFFEEEIEVNNDDDDNDPVDYNEDDDEDEDGNEDQEEEIDDEEGEEEIDVEDAFTHTIVPNFQNMAPLKMKQVKSKLVKEESNSSFSDANISNVLSSASSSSKNKQKTDQEQQQQQHKSQRSYYTAFKVWFISQKPKVAAKNPHLDEYHFVKLMKELWHGIDNSEKLKWRRKAQRMSKSGELFEYSSKDFIILHGRHPKSRAKQANNATATSSTTTTKHLIEPMDVAAHLKLLGESLTLIGTRLCEHQGTIAVQGSLSVLLDSLLCSLGSLMCLTNQIPQLDLDLEELNRETLDNIAYIMPGVG